MSSTNSFYTACLILSFSANRSKEMCHIAIFYMFNYSRMSVGGAY